GYCHGKHSLDCMDRQCLHAYYTGKAANAKIGTETVGVILPTPIERVNCMASGFTPWLGKFSAGVARFLPDEPIYRMRQAIVPSPEPSISPDALVLLRRLHSRER